MKIKQYGTVTFTTGDVNIDGWLVEREPSDPPEATTHQLLLGFAIIWARERFAQAMNDSTMTLLQELAKKKVLEKMAANSPKQ